MKLEKFLRLFEVQEGVKIDPSRYEEETGRKAPTIVRNGNLESLLFVSWIRQEVYDAAREDGGSCENVRSVGGGAIRVGEVAYSEASQEGETRAEEDSA
ncbi:MAG: hypothetical protein GWN86_20890 [Desulfobacterales bacterium]|nr:hypothetical protein [Candidatus Bathyarchaeota archaeon]NIR16245.1 hypothetical protein [Desulfobacterales bacterium]NIV67950.1 hypothetical protein [Candidatus Bathyarchaeota archaeon]